MKHLAISIVLFILCTVWTGLSLAEDSRPGHWLGAQGFIGASYALGDYWSSYENATDSKPAASFGGGFDAHFYINRNWAIATGAGIKVFGARSVLEAEKYLGHRVTYFVLPLMLKLDWMNVQLGLGVSLDVGLYGTYDSAGNRRLWTDDDWNHIRRCAAVGEFLVGYAFHVKGMVFVPAAVLSTHLTDDVKSSSEASEVTSRYLTVVFSIGIYHRTADK